MPPLRKIQLPASAVPPIRPSARRTRSRRMLIFFLGLIVFICYYSWPKLLSWRAKKVVLIPDPLATDPEFASFIDSFLLEISALMGEWYELFVKMRYLPEGAIIYPQNAPPVDVSQATALGMSAAAIQLVQHLPYVNSSVVENWGNGESPFVLGGSWAVYRGEDADLEQLRDPFYASPADEDWNDADGPYMRPDYVALSALGNHGTSLILNIKDRQLWTIDQISGNSDPTLQDIPTKDMKNRNALEGCPSRSAIHALKDYMSRYENLEWIPGGAYIDDWEGYNYAKMYRECGWPGNFDGTAFNKAREAFEKSEQERYTAEEPLRQLERAEWTLKGSLEALKSSKEKLGWLPIEGNSYVEFGQEKEGLQEERKEIKKYIEKLINELIPRSEKELVTAKEAVTSVTDDVKRRYKERKGEFAEGYY